ncbi:hypothetical protein TRIP_B250222 [uncultured Desulfatiglans sp.]|nr:hypothetical protein TRIP_B250222 [uncultured Desulfatiglans sp.]
MQTASRDQRCVFSRFSTNPKTSYPCIWRRSKITADTTGAFSCLISFDPEMVFLADPGVNLYVCLCGDLQVASR